MAVSLLIFLMPLLTGMDPATVTLQAQVQDRQPPPEAVERLKRDLGLDRPLFIQYATWVGRLARGDMGLSYLGRTPVSKTVMEGLKTSAILGTITLTFSISLAIPIGIIVARRPGSLLDYLATIGSQFGVAVPSYLLAHALILLFGIYLGILPSSGWRGPLFIILPALTLAVSPLAFFTQVTRASMLEVLSMDYIRTARAKGMSERLLLRRHALRNALIPVVTLASMWLAGLMGGALIVEVIFSVPGLGRVLFDAVTASDIPLVQGSLIAIVAIAVTINTLTDIAYVILNPAIRI